MTGRAWLLFLGVFVALGLASLAVVRCERTPPHIQLPEAPAVGKGGAELEITIADEGAGLVEAHAVLVHARGESELARSTLGSGALSLTGSGVAETRLAVRIDPEALGVPEGDAFVRVHARDASWWHGFQGNEAETELAVRIDLTPPAISLESGLTYVRRGGAAAVVYGISEPVARDGVSVGDAFFRGFPIGDAAGASSEGRRVAIFAFPVDAPAGAPVRVQAVDEAGNAASVRVAARLQESRFPEVPIRLSRRFLEGKVVELARELGIDTGDPVAAFRTINKEQRARDEARIRELAGGASAPRRFEGAFQQLPNSQVTSGFAERRRYFLDGKLVSEATHYGYDLATVAGGPITVANAGRVIHAAPLGIYGRCVLVDHGLGLVSLYGHLSKMDVAVGDEVERGQVLGRSGQTGLAGGDHLHFAILVDGVYVDPVEWWDGKWVREHFEVRIAGGR